MQVAAASHNRAKRQDPCTFYYTVSLASKTLADFEVAGSGVEHRVTIISGEAAVCKCTCPWYNKHGMERGPCKHVLAAQIVLEESETDVK